MIKVVFFASLREQLGQDSVLLPADGLANVNDVFARLVELNGESWAEPLRADNVLAAVNQEMADMSTMVVDADEVAFLPPVTGG